MFYLFHFFLGSKMNRSNSEVNMDRFNGELDVKEDKKKRGRSPFRFFSRKRDPAAELKKQKTPERLLDELPPSKTNTLRGGAQVRVSQVIPLDTC